MIFISNEKPAFHENYIIDKSPQAIAKEVIMNMKIEGRINK